MIPYLTKGREIAVTGEVTLDEYTGKDGAHKASLNVRVTDLTLVGGRGNAIQEEEAFESPQGLWQSAARRPINDLDDELPF